MSVMSDPRKHDKECPRPRVTPEKIRDTPDGRTVWVERCPTCKRAAVYDRPKQGRTEQS